MPGPRIDVPAPDFGAQGGDPSRGVDMDLSTCVNRYGPRTCRDHGTARASNPPTSCFTPTTRRRNSSSCIARRPACPTAR